MPLTDKKVADVLDRARSHLNDRSGTLWTDDRLLPFVKDAYAWLYSQTSAVVGDSAFRKISGQPYSDDLTYTANSSNVTAALPADCYLPEKLEWRQGSGEEWRPLTRVDELPSQEGSTPSVLLYWTWKNNNLYVNKAASNGKLRLTYLALFADLTSDTSSILIHNAVEALAYYAAAGAYASRGQTAQAALMMGEERYGTGALGFCSLILQQLVLNSQLVARRGEPFSGGG
jgi:hypothetical protein